MSDLDSTVKRLRMLKKTAGLILLGSFFIGLLATVHFMTKAFVTSSAADSGSDKAEIKGAIDGALMMHEVTISVGFVAFIVWMVCRSKLKANNAYPRFENGC